VIEIIDEMSGDQVLVKRFIAIVSISLCYVS
jgi:hypothetical protein